MIEVTIKPEDINAQVAQAVIDSALGAEVKRQIESLFKERYHTSNIVDVAVKQAVGDVVRKHALAIVSERDEEIKALVTAALTQEVMSNMVTKMIDSLRALR